MIWLRLTETLSIVNILHWIVYCIWYVISLLLLQYGQISFEFTTKNKIKMKNWRKKKKINKLFTYKTGNFFLESSLLRLLMCSCTHFPIIIAQISYYVQKKIIIYGLFSTNIQKCTSKSERNNKISSKKKKEKKKQQKCIGS